MPWKPWPRSVECGEAWLLKAKPKPDGRLSPATMKPKQVIATGAGVRAVAGALPAKLPETSLPGPPMPPSANSSPNPTPWAAVWVKTAPEGRGEVAGRRARPALAGAARLPSRQTPHRLSPRMTGRFKRRRLRHKEMMSRLRVRAGKPMRERRPNPRHRTWIPRRDGTKFRRAWRSPRGRMSSIRPAQNAPAGGNGREQADPGKKRFQKLQTLWGQLNKQIERDHEQIKLMRSWSRA